MTQYNGVASIVCATKTSRCWAKPGQARGHAQQQQLEEQETKALSPIMHLALAYICRRSHCSHLYCGVVSHGVVDG